MSISLSVKTAIEESGNSRENLMSVLQIIRSDLGTLSPAILTEVADQMGLSRADVYGTATFYSFLETTPVGKYSIRICRSISCDMKNKNAVREALENHLFIKKGETTKDGMFTLTETNCLGHCHEGPVMLVNDEIHTELTPDSAVKIIEEIRIREGVDE
ncbi:MAG: NADH-quinone oxidoreductase subunit NuoE [Deltaproteobacteria bacterium]|nr:NADH-quinone oxidoreductase subunit NuoE [Deltaproteobacteria bacterium]